VSSQVRPGTKYLLWAGVFSCFIGSVLSIHAFGIEFFPLRVISLAAFPFLLLQSVRKGRVILRFSSSLLILMLIYGFISLLWSPDPQLGFRSVGLLFTGVMFFLLMTRLAKDRGVLAKIMLIWSIAILVTSLLGFYETLSARYLFVFDESKLASIDRIRNSIGWLCPRVFWPNWNNFSFVNALSAPVLLGWAFETRGLSRAFALGATILAIPLVFISYSRAAILGLLIGLTIIVFCFVIRPRSKRFALIFMLMIMGFGTVYFNSNAGGLWGKRIVSAMEKKWEVVDNSIRMYYYTNAVVSGTVDSFGFGKGLGASTVIINGGSYHHYLLGILAELGFWFFLGHCVLIVMVCLRLLKGVRRGKNVYWNCGLLASCIAFPILCLGPSSIMGEGVYWLWLAFIVAFIEYDSNVMRLNNKQFQAGSIKCTS
jgi:hypothetical protein